jgi:hypothetical protein
MQEEHLPIYPHEVYCRPPDGKAASTQSATFGAGIVHDTPSGEASLKRQGLHSVSPGMEDT